MATSSSLFSLVVLAVSVLIEGSDSHKIGCYIIGQCKEGDLVGQFKADKATDCLSLCQLSDACTHFSFQQQERSCNTWSSCPSLDTTCSDCFSGDNDCTASGACYFEGQCQGLFIKADTAVNLQECQEKCLYTDECTHYTFDGSSSFCTMFKDCPDVGDCVTCVSGHLDCNFADRPIRIMVVAGYDLTSQRTADVEIVDLYSNTTVCPKPSDYPRAVHKMVGSWFDHRPHVCGGTEGSLVLQECTEYSFDNDTWSPSQYQLTVPRYNAHGLVLSNYSWLVTGGDPEAEAAMTSDVLVDPEVNDFIPGPGLPDHFVRHCVVLLNETHVMSTGGGHRAYIFDMVSETWTKMPDMAHSRHWHSCGLVENAETKEMEVMVAGGLVSQTVEIFSPSAAAWREGPSLPHVIRGGASVQLDKSFLIVGGYALQPIGYLDTIYEFNRFTETWDLKDQRLGLKRRNHVAMALPSSLEICT